MDPTHRGELDLSDGLPDPLGADQLRGSPSVAPPGLGPRPIPHGVPHRPDPVDAVILLMNPSHLLHENLVPQASGGDRPVLPGTVSAGGDEPSSCLFEDATDGLDPELLAMHVDERDHFVVGRSSSAAKN